MNSDLNFKCPQCGHERFEVTPERHVEGSLAGAICAACSRELTDDDIKAQALEIATAKMQGVLSAAFGDAFKLPG